MAVLKIADEMAVFDLDAAPDCDGFRATGDRPAFESGVIDIHLLGLGGDSATVIRIEDD